MSSELATPEEEAATMAADPDRLMKGEDPETTYLEDALHWLSVYEELVRFKKNLIAQTDTKIDEMPAAVAEELEDTDKVILDSELERLEHRLEFWKKRVRELQANQEKDAQP